MHDVRAVLAAFAAACLLPVGVASAQQHTCVLTMSMTDEVEVNNLDFTLLYGNADGEIEGSGGDADCGSSLAGTGGIVVNDIDATDRLNVAVLRLAKFSGPVNLLGCRFFWDSAPPEIADFTIVVTNAAVDGGDDNVHPLPKVKITKIECPGHLPTSSTTTTTTTTTTEEPTTTTLPPTTTTTVPADQCGIPVSAGDEPTASDALAALRSAVGLAFCELCVCDADGSGAVTATDSLVILRAAVGQPANLSCPPCV